MVNTGKNLRWYLKPLCYSEAFSLKVCCDITVLLWLQEALVFILKIGEISSRSQEVFRVHFEVSTGRNTSYSDAGFQSAQRKKRMEDGVVALRFCVSAEEGMS